jgi:hypothetical protein
MRTNKLRWLAAIALVVGAVAVVANKSRTADDFEWLARLGSIVSGL